MANKEVTVFVIDLGHQMGDFQEGREQCDLEWALSYFWDKISSKIFSGRKTDCVGVIGFKTNETNNDMEDDEFYKNISVLCPIQQITIKQIKELKKQLVPSNTNIGDAISGIIIGIDLISKYCGNLKYIKNLILITNGMSYMDFSDSEKIAYQVKHMSINISIFGIDFDSYSYGYKEDFKSIIKMNNEKELLKFANICNGTFASMIEVINSLNTSNFRKVHPVSLFNGTLTIGDPQNYPDVVEIMIQRYPRTRLAKMPSAHRYNVLKKSPKPTNYTEQLTQTSTNSNNDNKNEYFSEILTTKNYKIEENGSEKEISKEDLELGYVYGKTIIPTSIIVDELKYKTNIQLTILGFIKNKSFPRFMAIGESNIIVPAKTNLNSKISLSSLIHGMLKTNTLALAKIVTKTDKCPEMIMIAPSIENEFECLIELPLPFAEDCRNFKFPSMKKYQISNIETNSSIENIDSLMEKYVTKMDLSNTVSDTYIQKTNLLESKYIHNMAIYRLNQAISHNAIYPNSELPNLLPKIKHFMYPSINLLKTCEEEIEKLSILCSNEEIYSSNTTIN
ncbi:uncharacterized protein T551_00301 [Pneumocystis jirovecii RU7]|uniref:ATP-dependent DNA helicase II subunit 2 n=1 Tax=Pneumocystis jirovecii (strain RU7) TaxID=1408657 RepID=A0A0W4ZWQ9_PNEJ7|nr:uncharacterized protein T551_00301 [Pneumocystis jirovecii RU7]KTW32816.1 hypothetical protein T551_00301 [Pneumocystis jirovecii RU7]